MSRVTVGAGNGAGGWPSDSGRCRRRFGGNLGRDRAIARVLVSRCRLAGHSASTGCLNQAPDEPAWQSARIG
jgi:hypothetical protein